MYVQPSPDCCRIISITTQQNVQQTNRYRAWPATFKTFLQDFKASPADSITHALGGMNIEEEDLDDEYDFMDEDNEDEERRRQERANRKKPYHKYKNLMQQLANRDIDEVLIELDDIAQVCAASASIDDHTC